MATIAASRSQHRLAEPHTWQTQFWARIVRRIGRHWVMSRHIDRFCRPLTIEGAEHLNALRGPVIICPNHSSHFDTPATLGALPERVRARSAVAAAADKFYRPDKRGWWYSLFFNAFPIERGGGAKALDYASELLQNRWSIVMYPEGTRSTDGRIAPFHHGVSILAMRANVPVVPIYLEGLRGVMPKGQRSPQPAPVRIRIGKPVWLDGGLSVPEATAKIEQAMRVLAGEIAEPVAQDVVVGDFASVGC
jgi:1-acyl-sn-glycerol-3-phosphate acyltransferase